MLDDMIRTFYFIFDKAIRFEIEFKGKRDQC
jgi:hypothetical protein